MRRAWMVFLAGCGFQSNVTGDANGSDDPDDLPSGVSSCATLVYDRIAISVCPDALGAPIMIDASARIDTDAGTSTPPGLTCATLRRDAANMRDSADVCVIAASSITLAAAATLSAHGEKPLVLIGKTLTIEGTIDVASHSGDDGLQGAASDIEGCNEPGMNNRATGNGGGQGGTFSGARGGPGGNSDDPGDKGGTPISTIAINALRGGCAGGPSSGGGGDIGGHGGGAVWLSAIDGTLTLGERATINASGAGGQRGRPDPDHRGGHGGGSGGMIVLQAASLVLAPTAKIFANGGGGGGGGATALPGGVGGDPVEPDAGGTAGNPGPTNIDAPGAGGVGFPAADKEREGAKGNGDTNGGGGGGGGAGTIWIGAETTTGAALVSPVAERFTP